MTVRVVASLVAGLTLAACSSPRAISTEDAVGAEGGSGGAGTGDAAVPCACPEHTDRLVHLPLACFCEASDANRQICASNGAELRARLGCGTWASFRVTSGCGKTGYGPAGSLADREIILDDASDAVVGVYDFSDVNFGKCNATAYVYGENLVSPGALEATAADVCANITSCALCKGSDAAEPACP